MSKNERIPVVIIKPGFKLEGCVNGKKILEAVERAARTCYQSEGKMGKTYDPEFIKKVVLTRGHESVLEHPVVSVRIVCDRGVSHEWVRHRIGSYSQESTRYCNYGKKGMVKIILPILFARSQPKTHRVVPLDGVRLACSGSETRRPIRVNAFDVWFVAIETACWAYLTLLEMGVGAQWARSVLPNSLKTELVVTFNLREWRHFFKLRCSKNAHPQMRQITIPLLRAFQERIPIIFDDIVAQE